MYGSWVVVPQKRSSKQLDEPRPPYTTIASVMNNLKRKGYLNAEQHGLTYHFSPRIGQSEYKSDFMRSFVGNYFKNSFREMVSFFCERRGSLSWRFERNYQWDRKRQRLSLSGEGRTPTEQTDIIYLKYNIQSHVFFEVKYSIYHPICFFIS